MTEVHGHVDERFAGVREALEDRLAAGEEIGAAIHVDLDGEPVVDLWGGHRDEARTEPWTEDTIVNVWSTTKTVTSLAALVLVSRGELDVHAPVARYWPEFAQNGKQDVEVRHLMAHTSGVSGWEPPFSLEDVYDWERATAHLAAQAPWWEPGTAHGYHGVTFGHLVGEVIRRATGRTIGQIVGDLGGDLLMPLPAADDARTADLIVDITSTGATSTPVPSRCSSPTSFFEWSPPSSAAACSAAFVSMTGRRRGARSPA